jgi:hypothetical protein
VELGAVTTAVVGLAGIGYAAWNRWVSLLHDRTLADLGATRDVIEDARST